MTTHAPRPWTWTAYALCIVAAACSLPGCEWLDRQQPHDIGNPPRQIALTIQAATTQPAIEAAAAPIPWATLALSALGTIAGAAAAVFAKQSSSAAAAADHQTKLAPLGHTLVIQTSTPADVARALDTVNGHQSSPLTPAPGAVPSPPT